MAGDRDKTAGEAALEKAERRDGNGGGPAGERAQRSPQEREKDLAAGAIEPDGMKPTEADLSRSTSELQEDVRAAREELAETVEELGRKLDPRPDLEQAKQRAQGQAEAAKRGASDNATPIVAALAGVALAAGIVIWMRRR